MTNSQEEFLQFRISSALKNIIGRDLITDDFIAVFELIKNSFDAHATNVQLCFENDNLTIVDNGKGMSYDDLKHKWLFVAYSAKKDGSEDSIIDEDYRNEIAPKRHFAGAKGVGRFSCDRLGNNLKLITKSANKNSPIHQLEINWEEFEQNSEDEFKDINIHYSQLSSSNYDLKHGTVIVISNLRDQWNRKKIIQLKHSLEKLIHPYDGNNAHEFSIDVKAQHEEQLDSLETDERQVVNGPVKNFIFEKLSIKTTQIITTVSKNGALLTTELIDRGNPIYKIEEDISNRYSQLRDIRFQLFYLNRSAKITFTGVMGVPSHKFGSIFLYKNGFRVYPYGEVGEDNFRIDQRHGQGHSRTLGLRDLIGRIEIFGENYQFQETTSRDGGLIETSAYLELISCFMEKCFIRLEKYIVGIQWPLRDKADDITLLNNPDTRASIASLVAKLVDSESINLISYNKDFLNIIDQKVRDAFPALDALKKIAKATNDQNFLQEIQNAENEYQKLIKSEEAERKAKEKEAAARRKAEEEKEKAEEEKRKAEEAYNLERKKNLFFNATSHNNNAVLGLIHHIKLTSTALDTRVKILTKDIRSNKLDSHKFLEILSEIQLISGKVLKLSELITASDLNFNYEKHDGDLIRFIYEYLNEIKPLHKGLNISLDSISGEKIINFSPLEVTVFFDNFISNAEKAGANNLLIEISSITPLVIQISDDGIGVEDNIKSNLFELGVTNRRGGSGIGLANIREIIKGMQVTKGVEGKVEFKGNGLKLKGACFVVTL